MVNKKSGVFTAAGNLHTRHFFDRKQELNDNLEKRSESYKSFLNSFAMSFL